MGMNVVVTRNGKVGMTLGATINARGCVISVPQGYPIWDGERLRADGVDIPRLISRVKASQLTESDWSYAARMGDNGGGLVLWTRAEWDAAEAARTQPERDAKALRMAILFPGLSELRAALADEDRYHREFNRMMEDEDNDGVDPPASVRIHYSALAPQYPAAEAYLTAESYTLASNYAKAGAGDRAVKRLEAGEDYAAVIADMESEWSEAAHRAVMNS